MVSGPRRGWELAVRPQGCQHSGALGGQRNCGWVKVKVLIAQPCPALCNPMDCSPPDSSVHGILQASNTGVGCHALLQGIFPIQGSNPHSPGSPALGGEFFTTRATWEAP